MEKTKNVLYKYQNGNYKVTLLEDGTKIRMTAANEFIPAFAENCDVKITDKCDGGCPFCYEGCTPQGKHAVLFDENGKPVQTWLTELHPGTELALNGNDMSHPDLNPEHPRLLEYLKDKGIVTNLTVNQKHFMKYRDTLKEWSDKRFIYGLGVSLSDSNDEEFYEALKDFPNAVIHTIAGILTSFDIIKLINHRIEVLILGYKTLGRGIAYEKNAFNHVQAYIKQLQHWLPKMVENCRVVSFDNLALEQLDVKKILFEHKEKDWEQFYMGDDGQFTFYIDAVKQQYAKDSCVPAGNRFSSKGLTVDQMFTSIRK